MQEYACLHNQPDFVIEIPSFFIIIDTRTLSINNYKNDNITDMLCESFSEIYIVIPQTISCESKGFSALCSHNHHNHGENNGVSENTDSK